MADELMAVEDPATPSGADGGDVATDLDALGRVAEVAAILSRARREYQRALASFRARLVLYAASPDASVAEAARQALAEHAQPA
jgi:hypothetical protein